MRISATKGLAMSVPFRSGLRREDAEQRDDEIDAEVRLEVAVGLAPAGAGNGVRRERYGPRRRDVELVERDGHGSEDAARWAGAGNAIRGRQEWMAVSRDLRNGQGHVLDAAGFGQREAAALVDRQPAAQIREGERALAVAAVGGADQVEERLV